MRHLLQDMRYALRILAKNPGFAAVAVLTLALGIGANAAMFGLFNALALRPLPVEDPHNVVLVHQKFSGEYSREVKGSRYMFSYPEYLAYRNSNSLSELVAYRGEQVSLLSSATEEVYALLVSENYFRTFGATPVAGRLFLPEEARTPGSAPVAVLSHGFWQRRFGGDPAAVGAEITLNRQSFTVIGVTAPTFTGVTATVPDLWVPITMQRALLGERDLLSAENVSWLYMAGRLGPGSSSANAQAQLHVVARRLDLANPGRITAITVTAPTILSGPEARSKGFPVALAVMTAVLLVLLIACANVANMLLARSASRQREIAVRMSLGATRFRLLRQFVAESIVLALFGATAALLISAWMPGVLLPLVQRVSDRPLLLNLKPDFLVVAYTMVLAVLAGIAFGLAPALQATRSGLLPALQGNTTLLGRRLRSSRLPAALVTCQLAVCIVLLICAGLLVRGLQRASEIHPGYETRRLLFGSFGLSSLGYQPQAIADFHERLRARLLAVPGIESAALVTSQPLLSRGITDITLDDDTTEHVQVNSVSAGYFRTMGIALLHGQDFRERPPEGGVEPAIVTAALARRYWGSQPALGRRFKGGSRQYEVVGVASDIQTLPGEVDGPYFYSQLRPAQAASATLVIRTTDDPAAYAGIVRSAARSLDPKVLVGTSSMAQVYERATRGPRVVATLAGVVSLLALLLAMAGVYGVASFFASQRTREMGIRLALGAQPADVMALLLRKGLLVVVPGVVVGLAGAAALTRVLRAALHGLSPLDAVTFAGVTVLLIAVTFVASYLPARSATKLEPSVVLRHE